MRIEAQTIFINPVACFFSAFLTLSAMQRLFSLTLGLALVASVAGAPYTMLVCDEVSYGRRPRLPDQLALRPIPHKCCTVACTVASVDQLTHACIPLSLLVPVLSDPFRTLTTLPLCPLHLLDSPPSALPPPSFPLSRPSTLSYCHPPPTPPNRLTHPTPHRPTAAPTFARTRR